MGPIKTVGGEITHGIHAAGGEIARYISLDTGVTAHGNSICSWQIAEDIAMDREIMGARTSEGMCIDVVLDMCTDQGPGHVYRCGFRHVHMNMCMDRDAERAQENRACV